MRTRTIVATLVAVMCAASPVTGCAAAGADGRPTARIDSGSLVGVGDGGTRIFRGIPYAEPPVGDLRWTPPRPVRSWTDVRDATGSGPLCAQDGLELGRPSDSEDCLTLDVTTPAEPARDRPVVVWLHGGSWKDGGGSVYGARRLAEQGDVVVVTPNYRLGAFGFLAHPALPGAENLGLADQQAALRWVQRNAAAFGGDPGAVTLAGESAGGAAVCAHLASPAADGLFRRAIVQSADCTAGWSAESTSAPRARAVAEHQGRALATRLGCDDAACLRRAPVATVRAASGDGEGVGPAFGTPLLPTDPARGPSRTIPLLTGMNSEEERFRIYGTELAGGRPTTVDDYRREVGRIAGPDAAAVLAEYPCADDGCAATTLADVLTGRNYARGTLDLARRGPAFAYEFTDPDAPWFRDLPPARFEQGAFHTAELPFLFDVGWSEPLSAPQRDLADTMIGYWSRFVRTGDPNGADAPMWPVHGDDGYVHRLAPGGVGPADRFSDRHRVAFWSARR